MANLCFMSVERTEQNGTPLRDLNITRYAVSVMGFGCVSWMCVQPRISERSSAEHDPAAVEAAELAHMKEEEELMKVA